MKGYALLFLLVAAVLLLLPLPALPHAQATGTSPISTLPEEEDITPSTTSSKTSTTVTTANQSNNTTPITTFKVLSGDTVTELSCRDFLIRTLAFEMSPSYHAEALKAQAVAAYTYYGRRQRAQAANPDAALKGADFKTPLDVFPQEYTAEKLRAKWGDQYDAYYNKLCAAVDAVIGKHLLHNGEWIDACYFALSNGSTEAAKTVWGDEIPYLQAVASPGDRLAADYEKTVTFTPAEVKAALLKAEPTLTFDEPPSTWFGQSTATATGSVATLSVCEKSLAGTAIRTALGLRSASFTVTYQDEKFCFTTRGYGHGVGMSQYGADYLARQGYTWQEILQYYYTDVAIAG